MDYSIVQYYSEHEKYECGYCKKRDSNYSHGMWAYTMRVADYQDLIDRGWRRSGKYCYKPTNDIICCPMYTIRCRALEFKASKSQKKVLKKFNKYLMGQYNSDASNVSSDDMRLDEVEVRENFVENKRTYQKIDVSKVDFQQIMKNDEDKPESLSVPKSNVDTAKKVDKKDAGPDPTRAPCKKAKVMRRERKMEKLKQKGIDVSQLNSGKNNQEKRIESYFDELPPNLKNNLEVKLVRTSPPSPEWVASSKQTYELYVKYQTTVHGDKPEKCTEQKFKDFLIESPLIEEHTEVGPPCGYGSFQQQYWLDGRLVAVGVLDVLPKCISSVYFFYDPLYRFLTLGTYGALREIALTRHFNASSPLLQYYYMGYYIHSCPKMRYKGSYCPSDLLCPETYQWFDIKDCLPMLAKTLYTKFNTNPDDVDDNVPSENTVLCIPTICNNQILRCKDVIRKYGQQNIDTTQLLEYAQLVGSRAARKMVLVKL